MMISAIRHGVRSLGVAAGLAALLLAGGGCSTEEQAAVGTIEMGKADKNNLMTFGGGGEGAAATNTGGGSRGRGRGGKADSGGLVKSIKGGGGAGAAP